MDGHVVHTHSCQYTCTVCTQYCVQYCIRATGLRIADIYSYLFKCIRATYRIDWVLRLYTNISDYAVHVDTLYRDPCAQCSAVASATKKRHSSAGQTSVRVLSVDSDRSAHNQYTAVITRYRSKTDARYVPR